MHDRLVLIVTLTLFAGTAHAQSNDDVINPDLAVAMEGNFLLALPKGRWKLLSYFNMTSIENTGTTKRKTASRH